MFENETDKKILEALLRIEKLLEHANNPPHPLAAHLADHAKANAPKE